MDFREVLQRLMQQQQDPQKYMSDSEQMLLNQRQHQQMQAQEQARDQMMQEQMKMNRQKAMSAQPIRPDGLNQRLLDRVANNTLRQVPPEQRQMLLQELAGQSAPAASIQQMQMQRGGLGALPNAFMQRLQQQQQNQVPQDALGLGYGVQR